MGTQVASTLIGKARILLQDVAGVRWPDAEMLGWLNDGQREIVALRPDSNTAITNITLVAGTKQAIPSDGYMLMDVVRNMGADGNTPGSVVRKVSAPALDNYKPMWHTETASATTLHYIFDPRAPRNFYVYPPAVAGQKVETVYARIPTDVATTAGAITIDDIYSNALIDYMVYRGYSKDFADQATVERAAAARQAFENTLGLKAQSDGATQPNPAARS